MYLPRSFGKGFVLVLSAVRERVTCTTVQRDRVREIHTILVIICSNSMKWLLILVDGVALVKVDTSLGVSVPSAECERY